MEHFSTDIMRLLPAPTLARELPVTIANLLLSVVAVAVLIAVRGEVDALVITIAIVLTCYALGRTLWVAIRGRQNSNAIGRISANY